MKKQYYIYITTNTINGKRYIGKHYGLLKDSYLGSGTLLKRAIEKYGLQNFSKSILSVSNSEEENRVKEKEWIDKFDAVNSIEFYNIADGGQGGNTRAGYSKEERDKTNSKISLAMLGDGNPNYGKSPSIETVKKIKHSLSEYWTQEKRIERTEKYSGELNPMYGKKHSEKSKKKMSESRKGGYESQRIGIEMISTNKQIIKTFSSKKEALLWLEVKGHTMLNRAIKNKSLYKEHYWREIKGVETNENPE